MDQEPVVEYIRNGFSYWKKNQMAAWIECNSFGVMILKPK